MHSNAGSVSGTKAVLDADIAALYPSPLLKPLPQCLNAALRFRITLSNRQQHSYTPHSLALLRPCRQRPDGRRAAEQRDELAASDHSMTSSARASSVGGTSSPSALAALRLMAKSIFVAC